MPSVVVWLGGRAVPRSPKSAEPGSNKPQYLTAAVWLAEAGRFSLPTVPHSLLRLQPIGAFSLSTLFPWRLNSQQMFLAFVPFSWSQKAKTFLKDSEPKNVNPTGKQQLSLKVSLEWRTVLLLTQVFLISTVISIPFVCRPGNMHSELPQIKFKQVLTGLLRLKNECNTAGFWLSRASVWSKPEP